MLILLQTLILFVGILITGFLLIEGWMTQSVWSKDCSEGVFANFTSPESWLTKTEKSKNPDWYWKFMGLYGVIFLFFLLLLVL